MSGLVRISELPDFDAADYLDSEEAIAEFLKAMADSGDVAMLAGATATAERARERLEGMRSVRADEGAGDVDA